MIVNSLQYKKTLEQSTIDLKNEESETIELKKL